MVTVKCCEIINSLLSTLPTLCQHFASRISTESQQNHNRITIEYNRISNEYNRCQNLLKFIKLLINKMSTETQENIVSPAEDEQIAKPESATKTTKASTKKPKDPQKVAAGKKLAQHNRIARQALIGN